MTPSWLEHMEIPPDRGECSYFLIEKSHTHTFKIFIRVFWLLYNTVCYNTGVFSRDINLSSERDYTEYHGM
jgi:hypothetical protein